MPSDQQPLRHVHYPSRYDGGVWREIAPGLAMPETFKYREEPPPAGAPMTTLHMRLVDGEAICERVELEPQADVPLSTTALRQVPLSGMVEAARANAAKRITFDPGDILRRWGTDNLVWREIRVIGPSPDGRRILDTDAWLLPDDPARFAAAGVEVPRGSFTLALLSDDDARAVRAHGARQAIPMDDEGLRRVADVYRAAERERRRNPTECVAQAFSVSRMTASRWLRRARDLGYLPERTPRKSRAQTARAAPTRG